MDNSIEKQLLYNLNNDFKKRGGDDWNAKVRTSEYFETVKQLSPESIKKCIFIWLEDYLTLQYDSWNIKAMRIDFFAYLLQNSGELEEEVLISIVTELYKTDFKVDLHWWNINNFAWLNCLLSNFERIIIEKGINENISFSLDYFLNKGRYYPNEQLNDIFSFIKHLKNGTAKHIHILNTDNILGQSINNLIENQDFGHKFEIFFYHSKTEKDKSNPSKKWIIEAVNILSSINGKEFENHVISLFKKTIELIENEQRNQDWTIWTNYLDSASEQSIRGLVWVSSFLKSKTLNNAVSELGLVCLKKKPGVGVLSTKIGNACIYAFSNLPEKEGIAYLVKYKNTLKLPSTSKIVEKYIAELAKKLGKSAYDLEDLACESYGLDDAHTYVQAFDACVGEIKITNHDTVMVEWFNEKEIIQKSVPSSVKADFTSDYKDFTKKTKDIQASLRIQIQRLESFYLKDRQWKYADWKDLFLCHPFMGVLTKELIWHFEGKTQKETGFWNNNEWINPNQKPIEWINDETVVRLWHPLGFEVDTVLKWRNFLSEKQLIQPFKQAFREIYLLTEAELRTENYSNRFAAHILKNYQFGALCKVRNWQGYNQFHDGGSPTLEIKHHKISASFWVEIIYEGDNAGTYTSTDQVRFYKNNQQIFLMDVPAMVFSEAMRDVDLFVGVCSIGNDPNWIDAGNRYGDYWQSYSFGEISESAKTRKVVLERLIPRLKIAKIAELTGNFLKVKGKLRTYKIHLGSGNILMEPNDQYLCIVPERAKTKDKVFLPFEGDSVLSIILSKAFLLADDDKITDVTITRQIE